jgi:hypothetical protein
VDIGLQTRSSMFTPCFKQHLQALSGCDVSNTCTYTVCLRQNPFLKGTAFCIVLNCVYSLDQVQLLCNTTYHQYVYAVYSGSLSVEQMVPAEFPSFSADYRFHYYLPKKLSTPTVHLLTARQSESSMVRRCRNSRLWMMLLRPSLVINISVVCALEKALISLSKCVRSRH